MFIHQKKKIDHLGLMKGFRINENLYSLLKTKI